MKFLSYFYMLNNEKSEKEKSMKDFSYFYVLNSENYEGKTSSTFTGSPKSRNIFFINFFFSDFYVFSKENYKEKYWRKIVSYFHVL